MHNSDSSVSQNEWVGPDGPLGIHISEATERRLASYRSDPDRVEEDANGEKALVGGGYADRQLFELVQNSADSLARKEKGGRIRVRLTPEYLYCVDEGLPIDKAGVRALMFAHLSPKAGTSQIGRFGLGFKSVLGVTDSPEFYSRSGSFRFDKTEAEERIRKVAPDAPSYPVLRTPSLIQSPLESQDPILRRLAGWATNIVRLPLKSQAYPRLLEQIRLFPPELLLFVENVSRLWFDSEEVNPVLSLYNEGDYYFLSKDDEKSTWRLFNCIHKLSKEAKLDGTELYEADQVKITWAVPLERIRDPGYFWAFFPTKTASLVSGILNAPWKTHSDRLNLLDGVYNKELIGRAGKMIADTLPQLSTEADPARHLDALPRRQEEGEDVLTSALRSELMLELADRKVVPDQNGELQRVDYTITLHVIWEENL